jgi:hypothetical protein
MRTSATTSVFVRDDLFSCPEVIDRFSTYERRPAEQIVAL